MKIIVGADVAKYFKKPGAVDNRMAYVLGLRRLGHEVYLVEDRGSKALFDENWESQSFRSWQGTRFFETVARRYGIWPNCCLLHGEERSTRGLSYAELARVAENADLLLNLHGRIRDPEIFQRVPLRAYIDHDPGLTQVYKAVYDVDRGLSDHHAYFTFGLNIGTARSEIPDCGLEWHPIPPPVVLDWWPVTAPPKKNGRFTTISKWDGAQTFEFQGRYSGEKSDNWRRFIELPRRTTEELEIALAIHPNWTDDIRAFVENGWTLSDPGYIRIYDDYATYIRSSRGEFSIVNNRLVEFNTGGLSDRTVRYLASGRPAVVQSTGFEEVLPTGEGLLTFSTLEEAADRLQAVAADYPRHCRAAREIAEEFFDSDRVLAGMLEVMGLQSRGRTESRGVWPQPARS